MIITNKISVHLDQRRETPIINAVQGDSARAVEIALLFAKEPWIVPEGVTAMIRYKNLRKFTGGAYDTMPDGTSAYSFSENTVTLHLPEQVFGVDGHVEVQVTLIQNGAELTVFSFKVRVQRSLSDDVMTEEDYENLTEHIRNEVDTAVKDLELTGAVWVTVTQDGVGLAVDKSFAEIFDAHGDGQSVFCSLPDGAVLSLAAIDEEGALFQGEINREYQRVQIMADGTINYKSGKYALLEEIPAGSAGIYVGTEEPSDASVNLWINPEGEATEETESGGKSDNWQLITDCTLEEQVTSFSFDQDMNGQPFSLRKYMLAYVWNKVTDGSTVPGYCFLTENGGSNSTLYTSGIAMPATDKIVGGIVVNELLPNNTCRSYKMYDNISAKLDPFSPLNHQYVYNCINELKQNSDYKEFSQVGAWSGLFPAGSRIMLWGVRV